MGTLGTVEAMGLLDRFKKEPRPDALTLEAIARARAVPGVATAEAVDADTVSVTWADQPGASTLSLTDVRAAWSKASGFERIELMDDLIATLAPPADAPDGPSEIPTVVPPAPRATSEGETTAADTGTGWDAVRDRLRLVIGPAGAHPAAVTWPVAGVLEARVVLGGPGAIPVDADDVAGWGVSVAEVEAAARTNLATLDPGLDPVGPGQPAWVPTNPADHPPAWLGAPDRLLAATGLAEAVALAPTPTELVVVDPAAHDLLRSILTSTKQIVASEARVLWPGPLLLTGAGVAPWRPDPSHPAAELVAELDPGTR